MSHRSKQLHEFRKGLSRRICLWRVLYYTQLIMSAITSSSIIKSISHEQAGVFGIMSLFVTAFVGSTHPSKRECALLELWKNSIELETRIVRDKDSNDSSIDDEIGMLVASLSMIAVRSNK